MAKGVARRLKILDVNYSVAFMQNSLGGGARKARFLAGRA